MQEDERRIELGLYVGNGIVEGARAVAQDLVQDPGHSLGESSLGRW